MSASAQPWRRQPRYERLVTGSKVSAKEGNRFCAHPDCQTRLSRYNLDDTCNRHGGWSDEGLPQRGRKPKKSSSRGAVAASGRAQGPAPERGQSAPALGADDTAEAHGGGAERQSSETTSAKAPTAPVFAELSLEPETTAGRDDLAQALAQAVGEAGLHVDRGKGGAAVTGPVDDVLSLLRRAAHEVAPENGQLVVRLRLQGA